MNVTKSKSFANVKSYLVAAFALEALQQPVDLENLAMRWGVTEIQEQPIDSDGMLLPGKSGYTVILKRLQKVSDRPRQRFSLAHELSHLLLHRTGLSGRSDGSAHHRDPDQGCDEEERLCDQIAAEILMPRLAFEEDGWMEGWSLQSLRTLARKYETSIPATARRMVDLMPETSLMGVWRPPTDNGGSPKLQSAYSNTRRYGVPVILPRRRLWLIPRASRSQDVETGAAPVVDKQQKIGAVVDVRAEALAWGIGDYHRVMVFYYPTMNQSPN